MTTLLHFCLSIAPPDASMMAGLSALPAKLCLDLGLTWSNAPVAPKQSPCTECLSDNPLETAETLATSTRRGSFNYDWVSLPKHAAKLPPWSCEWYCQYHHGLACFMYVSYVDSLIFHLPSVAIPCFGSEAALDVLFFMNQSHLHSHNP